jgi:hypothetical protein
MARFVKKRTAKQKEEGITSPPPPPPPPRKRCTNRHGVRGGEVIGAQREAAKSGHCALRHHIAVLGCSQHVHLQGERVSTKNIP